MSDEARIDGITARLNRGGVTDRTDSIWLLSRCATLRAERDALKAELARLRTRNRELEEQNIRLGEENWRLRELNSGLMGFPADARAVLGGQAAL
jgi:hypothetical protein